jgi:hypothetical protein
MNPLILNRNFQHPADGWYQIEPKGDHPNRAAGVLQVIDDEAARAIVNRFNFDALAGKLSHGREMLVDHEHFKHDDDKETRAYGWLTQLQNRADGIYGQIRWTQTGQAAVDGGDYRFFSTEYDPADLAILNSGAGILPALRSAESNARSDAPRSVRPLRLAGLTLTNEPNNKGGRPITNRGSSDSAEIVGLLLNRESSPYLNADGTFKGGFDGCVLHMTRIKGHSGESAKKICGYIAQHVANRFSGAGFQPAGSTSTRRPDACATTNQNQRKKMTTVCTALGLSADAAEEAVLAEVTRLQNRLAGLQSLEAEHTTLRNRNRELEGEQCEVLLDVCGIDARDARRPRLKAGLEFLKNREERLGYLADFGLKPGETRPAKPAQRVLNRGTGDAGRPQAVGEEHAGQNQAAKIMNRARQLQKDTPHLTLATAVKMAQEEQTV